MNGNKFGRPRKVDYAEHLRADGHTGKDIARWLGVSRAPLYRHLATV